MIEIKDLTLPPLGVDAGSDNLPAYSGEEFTRLLSVLFEPGRDVLTAKPGVVRGLEVKVTARNVTVSPGVALVETPGRTVLTGVSSPAVFEAPAPHATFPRIDGVFLKVESEAASGRGSSLVYSPGTPAASPQLTPIAGNVLRLGSVRVPPISGGQLNVVQARAESGLDTPQGKKVELQGDFKGRIFVTRFNNQACVVFENLDVDFNSSDSWFLDCQAAANRAARSVPESRGFIGAGSSEIETLYPVRIGRDGIRVFGRSEQDPNEVLNGVIPINPA